MRREYTHSIEDCVGNKVPIPLCQGKELVQIQILALEHQAMLLSVSVCTKQVDDVWMFQALQDFQASTFPCKTCRVAAKSKLLPNNFDSRCLVESINPKL